MIVRVTGVFAHPDDDAYLMGGTLLRSRGALEPTVVFATSGEAGPISDTSLATSATLGGVREAEHRACMERFGYPDAPAHFLRHPDYYLPDVPFDELVAEIEQILLDARPHVVVTFGPDGVTSHHDHIRVGRAATEAFHRWRRSAAADESSLRLYHAALARSDVDRFYRGVREHGFDFRDEGVLFNPTGVPDERIAVRVDTKTVREDKVAGILCHRTQLGEYERIPEPLRWMYLDAECFVQAVPALERPGYLRAGLFDDLATTSTSGDLLP